MSRLFTRTDVSEESKRLNPGMFGVTQAAKVTPATKPAEKSPLAAKFEQMWGVIGGPAYVTELIVPGGRLFRFDYAWPERVALELQGGIHLAGRGGHVAPKGVKNDCDKLNLAAAHDWRVFKLATGQVTFENLDLIVHTVLRLRQASPAWLEESKRLFALERVTGETRHALAARNIAP